MAARPGLPNAAGTWLSPPRQAFFIRRLALTAAPSSGPAPPRPARLRENKYACPAGPGSGKTTADKQSLLPSQVPHQAGTGKAFASPFLYTPPCHVVLHENRRPSSKHDLYSSVKGIWLFCLSCRRFPQQNAPFAPAAGPTFSLTTTYTGRVSFPALFRADRLAGHFPAPLKAAKKWLSFHGAPVPCRFFRYAARHPCIEANGQIPLPIRLVSLGNCRALSYISLIMTAMI